MNTESNLDDGLLMAYADGELDGAQAAEVERAMQRDAAIAARVARHRALRTQLQAGLSAVLAEPVPERLLNKLATEKVIDLAQARNQKVKRWRSREWLAMAASLLAGIVLTLSALNFNVDNLSTARDGNVMAQGKLDKALTMQLASENDPAIKIGVSFRNYAGAYCRSFTLQASAGLACRTGAHWRVQLMTETSTDNSEFRQANSSTPTAVLGMIDQQIMGEPLDAEAEAAAQRAGWK